MINVLNLQGTVAISYRLYRAWVSEYQALPEMDARGDERGRHSDQSPSSTRAGSADTAVVEPTES